MITEMNAELDSTVPSTKFTLVSETSLSKKKKYTTSYNEAYSKEFPFILRSRKGEHFVFCNICCVDVKILHKGRGDITKHISTDKHQSAVEAAKNSKKLNDHFLQTKDDFSVIRAETLFTAFLVEHNIAVSAADHMAPLFKKMFPDSNIAKKYACARTKTTAIIGEMAKTQKNYIIESLKKVPFSVSTDGSNKGDKKLYPIVVTYFDAEKKQLETSLLSVPVLEGDSTGENIATLILDNLKSCEIPIENCLSLGSDNARVMIGKKLGAYSYLLKVIPQLFSQGCLCHLINLAAEKGAACIPINIEEYLVDIYYYLEKSVKRKERLKKFQKLYDKEVRKILKHVSTRWLSLDRCLKRLIEQWDPLTSFFKEEAQTGLDTFSSAKLKDYTIPKQVHLKAPDVSSTIISITSVENQPSVSHTKTSTTSLPSFQNRQISLGSKSKLDNFKFKKYRDTKESDVLISKETPAATSQVSINKLDVPKPLTTTSKKRKSETSVPPKIKKAKTVKIKENKSTNSQNILSREERIFMFLSSDINKAFVNFLSNIVPLFSDYNITFQSKDPKIHVSKSLLLDLFKNLLSRFVFPSVIKNSQSLLEIDYHKQSNQKLNNDIVIGQEAFDIVCKLSSDKKTKFYEVVCDYYVTICDYMCHKFPFTDEVLSNAEVANLDKIDRMSFDSIRYFIKRFPSILKSIDADSNEKAVLDKLQSQFCSIQVEDIPDDIKSEGRMDVKWVKMCELYEGKYNLLLKFMTSVLTLPHSNAECERIFSYVSKTQTQFRSQITAQSLESLLTVKSNMTKSCHEQNFDKDFLKRAKSATTVNNANTA